MGSAFAAAVIALSGPATAATITVDDFGDDMQSNGTCTLREAILSANTDDSYDECEAGSGEDEIILPEGTYTLALTGADEDSAMTGDLDMAARLVLRGAGAGKTIIEASEIRDRVFHILPGAKVEIRGVTITGGEADFGGGARNDGTLALSDCIVSSNSARGGAGDEGSQVGNAGGGGGGLYNSATGELTVEDCELLGNSALGGNGGRSSGGGGGGGGGAAGGALFNDGGTVTVIDSSMTGNTVQGGSGGNGEACGGDGGAGGGGFAGPGGAGVTGAGDGDQNGLGPPPDAEGGGGGSKGGSSGGNAGLGSGGGGGARNGGAPGVGGGAGGGGTDQDEARGGGGGGGGLGGAVFARGDGRVVVKSTTIKSNTASGGVGGTGSVGNSDTPLADDGAAGLGIGGGIFAEDPARVTIEGGALEDNVAGQDPDLTSNVTITEKSLYGCSAAAAPSPVPWLALVLLLVAAWCSRKRQWIAS